MKKAQAYLVKNKLILHSWNLTLTGAGVLGGPILLVESREQAEIGTSVLRVVSASRRIERLPDNLENIFDPVFKMAGIKGWKRFSKAAKAAEIQLVADVIKVIPEVYDAIKDDWIKNVDGAYLVEASNDSAIGESLIMALMVGDPL